MERLLKYCLSFVILSNILYSCDTKSALDSESKRHQAEKVYKKAIRYYQGTEEFQNGIIDAIHIDSTYDEAIRELSIAYLKRGYPHEWKKRIDKAVELNPILRADSLESSTNLSKYDFIGIDTCLQRLHALVNSFGSLE